jgi:WD40 repeat protein
MKMQKHFKIILVSLSCIAASLSFTVKDTFAQPILPRAENSSPSSQRSIKFLRSLDAKSPISAADISRDGKILVTSSGGKLQVWNLTTGETKTFSLLDGEYAKIESVAISPDLQTFVTATSGLDINFKNTTPAGCNSNSGSGSFGFNCNLGGSSSRTIKSTSGGAIQIWNLSTGKQSGILEYSENSGFGFLRSGFDFLRFSEDNNLLISSNTLGETKFWDVKTGKVIRQLNGERGSFGSKKCQQSLAINPTDSTQVFSAANLSIYNSNSKNKPITVSFPKDNQQDTRDSLFLALLRHESCTAFSPDGKIIAVSSMNDLHIWQSTKGDLLYRLPAQLTDNKQNDESYEYLAFSPDSQVLAGGKSDGTIQFWDMRNGKEISKTIAHSQEHIRFLGFTPDGTTLISIGSEGIIKLWEVR